jgi:predicted RND superfamily exporter protein
VDFLYLPERQILESEIDSQIEQIANVRWAGSEFWMSGGVHVKSEMSRLMLRDSMFVVPIAALVMAMVAFVSFRTIRGITVPVLTVLVSSLAAVAFTGAAFGSLNQIALTRCAPVRTERSG